MDELILLVPLLLPERDRGRQTRINHHLDQLSSRVGPARKSRSFNQSSPRPAVRTELPTFDSSTSTKSLERRPMFVAFFGIWISNYIRARTRQSRTKLFTRPFLIRVCERETLRFLAPSRAFFGVISALAVSHKT